MWNFIAKRSVWQDVSFPVGRNWEDYSVVYRIFNKSTTFEHINSYPILYRRREGSISTTRRVEILQKNVNDIILASEEILDFGADVKIMDSFFRHRKVPLPRKIFKTRISA